MAAPARSLRTHHHVAPQRPARRPALVVVPSPARRRAASAAVLVVVLLTTLMLASAVLSANLAPRQVQIDRLDQQLRQERERYGLLRRERAELRSPERLVAEAAALGMIPASETAFMQIDPDVVAEVQRSTGVVDVATITGAEQEFDRIGSVKRTVGNEP